MQCGEQVSVSSKYINSMAHMKRTKYGKVDLDYVLGIGGFDLERIENSVNEGEKEDHDHDDCHDHHSEHDHEHGHHDSHDHMHDPGVSSVSLVCEGDLDLEKANMWLGALLYQRSEDIYRMKMLHSIVLIHLCFTVTKGGKRLRPSPRPLKVEESDSQSKLLEEEGNLQEAAVWIRNKE